jgi:hypothetical protein
LLLLICKGQLIEGLALENRNFPLRSETTPDQKNVAHPALGDVTISLPLLHMKVGLLKIPEGK